jgi:hypothetical protein
MRSLGRARLVINKSIGDDDNAGNRHFPVIDCH